MCGSDELHSYPIRSFTYRTEQVRADKVQRVMVLFDPHLRSVNMSQICISTTITTLENELK